MRLPITLLPALLALVAPGLTGLYTCPAATAEPVPEKARSADAFVNGIGVNTHLAYKDTIYAEYDTVIKPRLKELGVRHIREGYFQDALVPRYHDLAREGIGLTLIMRSGDAVRQARQVLPIIDAVEGLNEPDHGEGWEEKARAEQRALYRAIKGDAVTAHLPVLVSGMANTRDSPGRLGALEDALDLGNTHNYAGGLPPTSGGWGIPLERAIAEARKVCGSKPLWSTECGYHNRVEQQGHPGVSETAAAKYFPRMHLLQFNLGIERRFSYELADEKPDPGMTDMEQHFGLLRRDGTPKPAFTALKNLIRILRDPGPEFQTGSLGYSLAGDTADLRHTLLQKRDGSFHLCLWQEVPSFDLKAKTDLEVPERTITLSLETPMRSAVLYRPNRSAGPLGSYANPRRLTLKVPDEVLIVKLVPRGAARGARRPAPGSTR